jgi:hypothetical protein
MSENLSAQRSCILEIYSEDDEDEAAFFLDSLVASHPSGLLFPALGGVDESPPVST